MGEQEKVQLNLLEVSREILGEEMIFECILKSLGQAEKKGESMPNIRHRDKKSSEFREQQSSSKCNIFFRRWEKEE